MSRGRPGSGMPSCGRFLRGAACVALVAATAAAPSGAQSPAPTPRETFVAPPDTIPGTPVVKSADPRSYVVVAVPAPAQLSGSEALDFHVSTPAQIPLLSRRSGRIDATGSQLLLTLGLPADAAAGALAAARVTFTAEGSAPVSVPVTLLVSRVRAVRIASPERLAGLYPGARAELTVQLTNAGNLADTVTLDVEAPAGWEIAGWGAPLELAIGQTAALPLRFRVPEQASTGDFFVRIRARGASVRLAEAGVSVHVGDRSSAMAAPGPTVRAAVAGVAGSEPGTGALQIEATGPLTADWSIDAQSTMLTGPTTTSAIRGLARVGTYVTSPTVRLWSPSSQLTAGNVQTPLNEITGVTAFGRGVAAQHTFASLGTFDVMAARPQTLLEEGEAGELLGLRHRARGSGVEVSTTAARLDAGWARLDAYGLDVQSTGGPSAQIGGGLAYRDYGDGSGMGVRVAAQHSRDDRHFELRAVHAPGGSRAFAPASDQLSGAASFRLAPRWSAGGSVFLSRDENVALQSIDSRSWSIFQQFRPRPLTTARVELRASGFDARGEHLAFGTRETAVAGALSTFGARSFSLYGSLGRIERSVDQEPLGRVVSSGPQLGLSGSAAQSWSRGTAQLEVRYQRTAPGMGYLAEQLSMGVSADRVRVTVADQPLTLNASLLHTAWGAEKGRGTTIARGGVSVTLPSDLALSLGLERNPFFRSASGSASWLVSLRLERSAVLPRLGLGSADGTVYQDLDGNDRRDDGEPGMPDVLVRRSGQSARTDVAGRYRFSARVSGEVKLDVSSLPAGWVVNEDVGSGRDFAVVPTSRIRVQLELVPSPLFAIRPPDLGRVEVLARDATGREWLARRAEAGQAVFDDLPAGDYTLVIDAARVQEPLTPQGGEVSFRVRGGAPAEFSVALAGRPIRSPSGTP